MGIEQKAYYASHGWRKATLISAIGIFCLAFWFLFRGLIQGNNIYWGFPFFILNFLLGLGAIYHYLKSRYVPIAQTGSGWVIIRQGARNRRPFTVRSRVKDIRLKNTDIHYIRNGLFSLMVCTVDGYRYFIYGLANRDRQELLQILHSG